MFLIGMMSKKLAIFSPSNDAYSETFIKAHRSLPFDIKFYYGNFLPESLEGSKPLIMLSIKEKIFKRKLRYFSFKEQLLLLSLKREGIKTVLAEYGPTAAESIKVLMYLNIDLIVHFHGFDATVDEVISRYFNAYKTVFNYAKKIIVVSNKMKRDLIGLGCIESKIIVTPCGPSDIFLNNQPKFNQKIFLFVGRFVDKKGPLITIEAFKKIADKFPDTKLIMIGVGPLVDLCRTFVKIWKLENNVSFEGVRSPEEIRRFLEDCLAYVQHSITAENGDSEGTPVAVLEAQAAAIPVISTNHGGIPDVVVNNESGILVDELDTDGMSNAMEYLINNMSVAKSMGLAGRKRVVEKFTLLHHLNIVAGALGAK